MSAKHIVRKLLEADDLGSGEIERQMGRVVPRLLEPYTIEELTRLSNNGENPIEANVEISLWDLIENDLEWLNDTVSERITGSSCGLEDIGFEPAGVIESSDGVVIRVTGSVGNWLATHGDYE